MAMMRIGLLALSFLLLREPVFGGIQYRLREQRSAGPVMQTVSADGASSRVETEVSENVSEGERQYPIVISTDGRVTQRHLRPENQTWYEYSDERDPGVFALGENPRLLQPAVSLTEEVSAEIFDGRKTRKFLLKASYVIESTMESEKLKEHTAIAASFWVVDLPCAPKLAEQPQRPRLGVRDLDREIVLKLAAIDGLIVRTDVSHSERYEGGAPRTFESSTNVVAAQCLDLSPALFKVPENYERQEPVWGFGAMHNDGRASRTGTHPHP